MDQFLKKMLTMMQGIWHFDVEKRLGRAPVFNDSAVARLFLALIVLNVVTYFMFIAQHPLYNHGFRTPWIEPNHGVPHGRWFNIVLSKITNSADAFALVPLVAILMNVVSGILTVKIWNLKLSPVETFLVVGFFTAYPAFLAFYYFSWTTILFMSGGFFATLAVYYCRALRVIDVAIGSVLVMILMASYQPSISVYATISTSAALAALISKKDKPLQEVFKPFFARILAAAFGLGAYVWSVKKTGVTSYTVDTIELSDIPQRVLQVIEKSIEQLTITQPELMEPTKLFLLLLLFGAVLVTIVRVRHSWVKIGLTVAGWFGLLVVTKTMYLLSPTADFFTYRYNTSLAYFHAFTAATLISGMTPKSLRSTVIVFIGFILLRFVQADLTRQEVLLRGQQHDLAYANRLLNRLESLPDLDSTKTYDLVRVGRFPHYRNTLLRKHGHTWKTHGDGHMDDARLTADWTDEDIFILLGSSVKFKHRGFDPGFQSKVKDAREHLLEGRKPWPHESSVFISEDKIILYLN